jgi:hypothetical protein
MADGPYSESQNNCQNLYRVQNMLIRTEFSETVRFI